MSIFRKKEIAEVVVETEQLQVLVGQVLGQVEARRAADAPAELAAAGEARSDAQRATGL